MPNGKVRSKNMNCLVIIPYKVTRAAITYIQVSFVIFIGLILKLKQKKTPIKEFFSIMILYLLFFELQLQVHLFLYRSPYIKYPLRLQ